MGSALSESPGRDNVSRGLHTDPDAVPHLSPTLLILHFSALCPLFPAWVTVTPPQSGLMGLTQAGVREREEASLRGRQEPTAGGLDFHGEEHGLHPVSSKDRRREHNSQLCAAKHNRFHVQGPGTWKWPWWAQGIM